jgi:hypothetical protein
VRREEGGMGNMFCTQGHVRREKAGMDGDNRREDMGGKTWREVMLCTQTTR